MFWWKLIKEKKPTFFMLYHKCKALLAEQVSGRGQTPWKRKDSFHTGCQGCISISQVLPDFVDPKRAVGYFTFRVLWSSSADPGWICPWKHDPPAPAHSLHEFYSFTPLKVKKKSFNPGGKILQKSALFPHAHIISSAGIFFLGLKKEMVNLPFLKFI